MSTWASNRKRVLVIVGISLAIALAVLISIPFIYKIPSCTDGKQNQGEAGIDCGGSCARVCTAQAQAPNVRFVRTLAQVGRTDVIAYIDNRNTNAAAENVPYTIEVYDISRTMVGKKQGTLSLAPGMTTPLFVPGILTGTREATQAFVTIRPEEVQWFKYEGKAVVPTVREAKIEDSAMPRIIAVLENNTAAPQRNVAAIVTVFDQFSNAIAASRTVVGEVPANGTAQAIFTWPSPFSGTPVKVEVLPVPVP